MGRWSGFLLHLRKRKATRFEPKREWGGNPAPLPRAQIRALEANQLRPLLTLGRPPIREGSLSDSQASTSCFRVL